MQLDRTLAFIKALQLDARGSILEAGRSAELSAAAARQLYSRLIESCVLRPMLIWNPFRVGAKDYTIYYSLSAEARRKQKDVLAILRDLPPINWASELSGEYQISMCVRHTNTTDLVHFLDELSARFPAYFSKRILALSLGWTFFQRCFDRQLRQPRCALTASFLDEPIRIDEADWALIRTLEMNPLGTLRELSEALNTPVATIAYRLDKLQSSRVILGTIYRVNLSQFGYYPFRALIQVEEQNPDVRQAFYEFAAQRPEVTTLDVSLGHWDFELRIELKDPSLINHFSDDLLSRRNLRVASVQIIALLSEDNFRTQEVALGDQL